MQKLTGTKIKINPLPSFKRQKIRYFLHFFMNRVFFAEMFRKLSSNARNSSPRDSNISGTFYYTCTTNQKQIIMRLDKRSKIFLSLGILLFVSTSALGQLLDQPK